jgi:hypothetical protein
MPPPPPPPSATLLYQVPRPVITARRMYRHENGDGRFPAGARVPVAGGAPRLSRAGGGVSRGGLRE